MNLKCLGSKDPRLLKVGDIIQFVSGYGRIQNKMIITKIENTTLTVTTLTSESEADYRVGHSLYFDYMCEDTPILLYKETYKNYNKPLYVFKLCR